jgi:hypothetical protein
MLSERAAQWLADIVNAIDSFAIGGSYPRFPDN